MRKNSLVNSLLMLRFEGLSNPINIISYFESVFLKKALPSVLIILTLGSDSSSRVSGQ
jgi:hypothetical protein